MITSAELLARMLGDVPICREILTLGLREGREQAMVVTALRTGGPLDATRRALHSLRGSAALFGAESFVALLGQMETDAEDGLAEVVLASMDRFEGAHAHYEKGLRALAVEMRDLP